MPLVIPYVVLAVAMLLLFSQFNIPHVAVDRGPGPCDHQHPVGAVDRGLRG
jgi:ABC-type Fe3+ transport system permease subunit